MHSGHSGILAKQESPFRAVSVVVLTFCLFEEDALTKRGVELGDFDLAFDGLLILTRPNDVIGLRRFQPEQAVL